MSKKEGVVVPAFELYGETSHWPSPEWMHCELIAERSRLHDWEIKPHRHVDLTQILYIQAGSATLTVEEQSVSVQGATLQVVPALSIHTFKFSSDVQGYILTLAAPLIKVISDALGAAQLTQPTRLLIDADRAQIDLLFNSISAQYRSSHLGRELSLHSLINLLAVWVSRQEYEGQSAAKGGSERGVHHLNTFVSLVESHYSAHWPISKYASKVGVSTNHLNALCRRLSGKSALEMINNRLLLEAKRCLVYTDMTVGQVSDHLGFSEPGYFSRFFKRYSGVSPRLFRLERNC